MRKVVKCGAMRFQCSLLLLCVAFAPQVALAGMTVYGLNDVYRVRMEEISFFVLVFLVASFVFKWLWNSIAKDFTKMPRLKWRHAVALALTLGLGMLLVLTMISGIREVLTPDAWRRQGSGYKLNSPVMVEDRRWSIQQLRDGLMAYARNHDGRFPPHDFVEDLPAKLWETPDPKRLRYHYRPGATLDDPAALVAWEPKRFGDGIFAIFGDGHVRLIKASGIGEGR